MTAGADSTTVRRSVVVDVPVEQAFSYFTEGIGRWWDPRHHLLQEPLAEMVFEARVGGGIIDRGVEGAESRWATVLVFDPPTRVAFSWSIDLQWQIEPDLARASEVHVTFTPRGDERTLVELEHRHLDRHGPGWESMRNAVDSPDGWDLAPFARAVAAEHHSEGRRRA